MCLQVTRLLVDAVTVSTANTEREHCFLPSHKGSPYHVHKLAERVLPAELLQVSCAVQSKPLSIHTPSSCSELSIPLALMSVACILQGPKSYNDALAKRFERKKGDMGSSSTGVKDRGIFVAADFRNPRTDQELQVGKPSCTVVYCLSCVQLDTYFAERHDMANTKLQRANSWHVSSNALLI